MMTTEQFTKACTNAGYVAYSIGNTTFAKFGGDDVAEYTDGDKYALAVGRAFTDPTALEEALKNI